MEFANNSDRELAFRLLKDKQLKDGTGRIIECKRALTSMQRDRNTALVKAADLMKKSPHAGSNPVKLDWQNRCVKVSDQPVFIQERDDVTGTFVSPFDTLHV